MLVVFSLDAYLLGDAEVSIFSWIIANSCQYFSKIQLNVYMSSQFEVSKMVMGHKETLTCSICPIAIIRSRVIIQKACFKPFSSHSPVDTHVQDQKRADNLHRRSLNDWHMQKDGLH